MERIETVERRVKFADRTVELINEQPVCRVQVHYGDKLAVADATCVLGLSRPKVEKLIKTGVLSAWHMGGRKYVVWADIERLLREGETTSRKRKS